MSGHHAAKSYLSIDRRSYDALTDRLVDQVKKQTPSSPAANDAALKDYFAVALTKGADLANFKFEELAQLSPDLLAKAANELSDKLTPKSRQEFAEAANRRQPAMLWNKLFPQGNDEIILPITAEAQSIDDNIAAYIDRHNQQAPIKYAEAKARGAKDAGKVIDQQEIRRDPNDPAKLQIINPNKPVNEDGSRRWQPGPRLGSFLEQRTQWALLDDFSMENSRKQQSGGDASMKPADIYELIDRSKAPSADHYDPESLQIVISRDPQKVGEMSSGQHWKSCMSEGKGGINFHYVPKDIEAGSLVAYLVAKDDPQARYPLMRQLLKPHYNKDTGETALIPATLHDSSVNVGLRH